MLNLFQHQITCFSRIMSKRGYTYILASQKNGTLYIGITSELVKRIWQHKNNIADGFTRKYAVHRLVYFDVFEDISDAVSREKQLKRWHRQWKLNLIEQQNPDWRDLYPQLLG